MRIAHVLDLGYLAGGAERGVKLLSETLVARGHEVLIIATDTGLADHEGFADVTVPAMSRRFPARYLNHTWYRRGRRAVAAHLADFQPDIVHLHTIGLFSPSLFAALGSFPAVMTVHGPEEFVLGLLAWHLPASDYRGQTYRREDLRVKGRLRYRYLRHWQRPLYLRGVRLLRAVFAQSAWMLDLLARELPAPTRRLYTGIAVPRPLPLPPDPTILFVGRLVAAKGVDCLLAAMARLATLAPQARLEIVGDGPDRGRLEALAARLGLEGMVQFTGWVPPQDLDAHYRAARVVAIPSVWPENLCLVALEALARGRPVVGTNLAGIAELVTDGVNGLTVAPRDAAALASALAEILNRPELAARMAAAAPPVCAKYDISACIDDVEAAYRAFSTAGGP